MIRYNLGVKTTQNPVARNCDFLVVSDRNDVLTLESLTIKIVTTKYALEKVLHERRCITPNDCFVFEENGVDQKYTPHEKTALLYAENYGIIDYTTRGNMMLYYADYSEGTYKITVNLDTGKEERKLLKRRNRKGKYNAYR